MHHLFDRGHHIAAPTNSQDDRFYVRSGTRKKDVQRKPTASNETDLWQVSHDLEARLHCYPFGRAGCQVEWRIVSQQPICTEVAPRCARYPRTSSLCFNRTAPQHIEHATLSLSWSERHLTVTSYLRHCGHQIRQISTRSTTVSGVHVLQQKVYRSKIADVDQLKTRL